MLFLGGLRRAARGYLRRDDGIGQGEFLHESYQAGADAVLNRVSSPKSTTMERILTLSTTMKSPRFDSSSLLIGRERLRICVLLDR